MVLKIFSESLETMKTLRQRSGHLGVAAVQDLLDDIHLDVAIQSSTQLPDRAADAALLHPPSIQHLVHHLRQAVAEVVVLDGLYLHVGQTQAPCTVLPFFADVFLKQIQVLLRHHVVLWAAQEINMLGRRFVIPHKKPSSTQLD